MLNDLRASVKWPEVFEDQRFANDQKTFDDLLTRIRQEAFEGNLSARTLQEARAFLNDLRTRVQAQPLSDPNDQKEALSFITTCTSLLDLLDMPNIRPALLELRKIQDTMVGNLLGFMHAYNLRFGVATTPQQRQAYQRLFEILKQTRDQILAEAQIDSQTPTPTNPRSATNFFQKLNENRSRAGASPQPPGPRTPQ
jgi:hypothetical protein